MPSDNKYMTKYMADRYILLKIKAIDHKGSKCSKCGYDKCYAALEFHHRDPTEKEFSWKNLRKQSWATILLEIDKCNLLCANCHREEHFDETLLISAISRMEAKSRITIDPTTTNCNFCHKQFEYRSSKIRKYCSKQCSINSRMIINWPDNLPFLVEQSSMRAVAKELGVSAHAVADRLKNHHNT